jgi:hypothetical protein
MNKTQMRWIEQAERRRVVAHALFERTPTAPWSSSERETATPWLPRLGQWLATRHPMGWETTELQPALVRRPARRRRS